MGTIFLAAPELPPPAKSTSMAPSSGSSTPMSSADTSPDPATPDTDPAYSPPPPRTPSPHPPPAFPPSSSGGSLSRIGLSPFTHKLAPTPRGEPDRSSSSEQDDVAKDSRDVLLQRLADLAERVSGESPSDESVSEMHRRVDEMEDLVKAAGKARTRKGRSRPKSLDIDATRGDTGFWGPAPSPSALLRSGFSDPTHLGEDALRRAPTPWTVAHRPRFPEPIDEMSLQLPALVQMRPGPKKGGRFSAEDAARIAREAEQLNVHLATLITRLHARQEESEHIHALLIEKAERAAQRIIVLEDQVQELTSTVNETTSDLTNLRISLKAIELQCPPPQNLDEDLRQSIQNWKADWKRIKETRASRRHHRRDASLLSSPGTPW